MLNLGSGTRWCLLLCRTATSCLETVDELWREVVGILAKAFGYL